MGLLEDAQNDAREKTRKAVETRDLAAANLRNWEEAVSKYAKEFAAAAATLGKRPSERDGLFNRAWIVGIHLRYRNGSYPCASGAVLVQEDGAWSWIDGRRRRVTSPDVPEWGMSLADNIEDETRQTFLKYLLAWAPN